MKIINVAIDGPAGAGKSTISRKAAAELGYIYIDTGALYRTVGLNALKLGADIQNDDAVIGTLTDELKVELKFIDGEQRMFLNGEDVSSEIRTPEASMAASRVSAVPRVREYLFDLQKEQNELLSSIALRAASLLRIDRYCRVDFILSEGIPYCLEINTLPGMTPTSLFPQEAAAVGLSYADLCLAILEEAYPFF